MKASRREGFSSVRVPRRWSLSCALSTWYRSVSWLSLSHSWRLVGARCSARRHWGSSCYHHHRFGTLWLSIGNQCSGLEWKRLYDSSLQIGWLVGEYSRADMPSLSSDESGMFSLSSIISLESLGYYLQLLQNWRADVKNRAFVKLTV